MDLLKESKENILIFDGAMGTMLQQAGLGVGELPETYNIEKAQQIEKIHKSYVQAGAQVVTTNTFQANRLKLENCKYSVEDIIQAGVKVAKAAGAPYVALDIGPLGQMMKPVGDISFQEAYEIFKEQVEAGVRAGADCILIETLGDLYEAKVAILAAKENSSLPVLCTMTFQKDGRTFLGTDPITAVQVLQGLGVDALGINCSLGPKEMMGLISTFLEYAKVPVMVQSNAGLPIVEQEVTIFPVTAQSFGEYAKEMAKLGVQILGGCCGTTPDHIGAIKKAVENLVIPKREIKSITCACSATKTVIFDHKTTVIGERINPTGKKRLKEALRNHQIDVLLGEAIDQTKGGAQILDVNVGLPDIEEVKILPMVVAAIQEVVDVPLQVDSMDAKAIEAAVRLYNGKPIINSVNGKREVMKEVFPIAQKYGATLIALTLDDKGIPATAEERVEIARKIIEEAKRYGIAKEDIIIDCLVMTASAQQSMVKETLRAVTLVKEQLGGKTTLGVSNVSFGLPNRELLNRTFLSAALGAGLDAPILDPLSKEMMDTIGAFRVLNHEDIEASLYIESFKNQSTAAQPIHASEQGIETLIIQGRKVEVVEQVKKLVLSNPTLDIINQYFIPALDQVGKRYEEGEFFLPQLLRSAEAVKAGLEIIKIHSLQEGREIQKGKVLLATVKGDIHDIGKNIARMLLENYSFTVIDLGKDVTPQVIVEAVKKNNIKLVGLSALMTTTVKNMQLTIEALKKEVPDCKVMVGGAVLTPEYAQRMGADFYAGDGQAGIRIARNFFES